MRSLNTLCCLIIVILSGLALQTAIAEAPELTLQDENNNLVYPKVVLNEIPLGVADPHSVWNLKVIYVCWIGNKNAYTDEKKAVRDAISTSWEKESRLKFSDVWGPCTTDYKRHQVRILIEDSPNSPSVDALGTGLGKFGKRVRLNFEFVNWQTSQISSMKKKLGEDWEWPYDNCTKPENRSSCIKATAIHEFGHVLALHHEQYHPDTEQDCLKFLDEKFPRESRKAEGKRSEANSTSPRSRVKAIQKYDPNSVMNYCRLDRMTATELSQKDKDTLLGLYCKDDGNPCRKPNFSM